MITNKTYVHVEKIGYNCYNCRVSYEHKNNAIVICVSVTDSIMKIFRKTYGHSNRLKEIAELVASEIDENFKLRLNPSNIGTEWIGQYKRACIK